MYVVPTLLFHMGSYIDKEMYDSTKCIYTVLRFVMYVPSHIYFFPRISKKMIFDLQNFRLQERNLVTNIIFYCTFHFF